jgi:hypothetical protein
MCRSSGGAREKGSGDETQFITKIGGETDLGPSYFCFVKFHSQSHAFDTPIIPKLALLAP